VSEIIIYQAPDGSTRIDTLLEDETVWLTNLQLSQLFGVTKSTISEHIKNIFDEGELTYDSVVRKFRTTATDGKTYNMEHYNLELIISLGYRINSVVATRFRQWATAMLKEYIVKGFAMDDERLKKMGGGNYFKELLARIRDIRSSEKALYRQVLDLYATSVDYDPKALHSIKFFKIVQNKLHYAVNKQTAAELIYNRADADKEFMGLTVFAGDLPVLEEVRIAKNYLDENELRALNGLVSAYFELAEMRASHREAMSMKDHITALDKLAKDYGEGVLTGAGKISHQRAMAKAEREYRKYQVKTLSTAERDYLEGLKMIENKSKNVVKNTTNKKERK
jgi:hypothetical protein